MTVVLLKLLLNAEYSLPNHLTYIPCALQILLLYIMCPYHLPIWPAPAPPCLPWPLPSTPGQPLAWTTKLSHLNRSNLMTLPVQQPYLLPHQDQLLLLLKQLQPNPVNLGFFFLVLQPPVPKSSQPNPVTLTSNPLLTLVYIFDWLIYELRTPKTDLFFMKYRPIFILLFSQKFNVLDHYSRDSVLVLPFAPDR